MNLHCDYINIFESITLLFLHAYQLTKDYPEKLIQRIIGFTRNLSTDTYYLVINYDIRPVLKEFKRELAEFLQRREFGEIQYSDFYDFSELEPGGFGIVYTAKHNVSGEQERVALKRFKNFNEDVELFLSEVGKL